MRFRSADIYSAETGGEGRGEALLTMIRLDRRYNSKGTNGGRARFNFRRLIFRVIWRRITTAARIMKCLFPRNLSPGYSFVTRKWKFVSIKFTLRKGVFKRSVNN